MKKGHLIALAVGLTVLLAAAVLYLSEPVHEQEELQPEESSTVLDLSMPVGELNVADPDDEEDDFESEITRIVVDQDEKDKDVRDILSEKILINDEVIDNPDSKTGDQ